MEHDYQHLLVELRDSGTAWVTINRPQARNSLHAELIAELNHCFHTLASDPRMRCIVLTGAGTVFSAGADITWMKQAQDLTDAENLADAQRLAAMFAAIDRCPKPVIARVNGAAIAGGAGLVAVCDIAVAVEAAQFAFPEAALGIIPATIAPYVVRKMGAGWARFFFLTGDRFPARRAFETGLVHEVVDEQALDKSVARYVAALQRGGPNALAAA